MYFAAAQLVGLRFVAAGFAVIIVVKLRAAACGGEQSEPPPPTGCNSRGSKEPHFVVGNIRREYSRPPSAPLGRARRLLCNLDFSANYALPNA